LFGFVFFISFEKGFKMKSQSGKSKDLFVFFNIKRKRTQSGIKIDLEI